MLMTFQRTGSNFYTSWPHLPKVGTMGWIPGAVTGKMGPKLASIWSQIFRILRFCCILLTVQLWNCSEPGFPHIWNENLEKTGFMSYARCAWNIANSVQIWYFSVWGESCLRDRPDHAHDTLLFNFSLIWRELGQQFCANPPISFGLFFDRPQGGLQMDLGVAPPPPETE